MGQFRIFLVGCHEGMPIRLPVSSLVEMECLNASGRFLIGDLVDVPDADGVCTNRQALIPISRIQMIMEDHQ